MKRLSPPDSGPRFQAQVRHYHRSSPSKRSSWNEWVDGHNGKPGVDWPKSLIRGLIVLGVLAAVGALIVGFIKIA